jgi:iron complex transport system ATP-binding protein
MILKDLQIGYKASGPLGPLHNSEIKKGKFTVVLGQKGVGKASCIRTLSGLQEPLSGTVEVDHKNIDTIPLRERSQHIGIVLTEKIQVTNYTVREYVGLGRYPYTNWVNKFSKSDWTIIDKAIQETGSEHLANRRVSELSDGEQQKVQIAKVLAQETPIIVLDEPTAHLDIHHKIQLFKILKKQVSEYDKTVIMASHEVNLSLKLSDKLILLIEDQAYYGTAQELVKQNKIQKLFPEELVKYDSSLGQFILVN